MGCHKARDSLSDSRGPSGWNTMHSCNSDIEDERLYMVVEIRMYILRVFQ